MQQGLLKGGFRAKAQTDQDFERTLAKGSLCCVFRFSGFLNKYKRKTLQFNNRIRMGYDIVAYFDVNQKQIEDFIVENNINRDNWNQGSLVVEYYKRENTETKDLRMYYIWNEECQLHEFYDSHGTNFIRDDGRLSNAFFMRDKPYCLSNINHGLHTAEDAVEIADALEEHFSEDDHNLMSFADWLRTTSKHCVVYELSC